MTLSGYAVCFLLCDLSSLQAAEAKKSPELVGTVGFDVQSRSGRVETLEMTIGDGGTGPYKAILSGDPGLPTPAI